MRGELLEAKKSHTSGRKMYHISQKSGTRNKKRSSDNFELGGA
jgi:hypothetical protein